jgi:hydroxyacylglutathione hydrolase
VLKTLKAHTPVEHYLPGEAPVRGWRDGDLYVDILPSCDLGNSSFLLVDRSRRAAVVIDPTRDVSRYLDAVEDAGLTVQWVLDTHLHADFVSGSKELAELGGARFGLSDQIEAPFPHDALGEHANIPFGSTHLTLIRSPGHTPEHVSFLLHDVRGRARVLFSGGSLMAGTAARPDLLGPRFTNALVREEFTTLHDRFRPLAGSVTVLPTHAGGSFCGVGARAAIRTSLARERRTNPLLRARKMASFFGAYLSDQPFPKYYDSSRTTNRTGGRPLGRNVPELPGLEAVEVERLRFAHGLTILDIRSPAEFERAHIPGSISISEEGPLTAWVGWLRPENENFVLVDDDPGIRRAVQIGLLRIGYDGLRGYLAGGIAAYAAAGFRTASTPRISMAGVRKIMERGQPLTLLDVRNRDEVARIHVPGAINIPLPRLEQEATSSLTSGLPTFVHCESGYRAGIAASLLERLGFKDVRHVIDGPGAWKSKLTSAAHAGARQKSRSRPLKSRA